MVCSICWLTAERIGAVLSLRVEDCYLPKGRPAQVIRFRAETRKGGFPRECPVSPRLRVELETYQPGEVFMFETQPGRPLSYKTFAPRLQNAVIDAGLDGRCITSHSFRRAALSRLANHGVAVHEIKAWSGHRSLSSLSLYLESDPARMAKLSEML